MQLEKLTIIELEKQPLTPITVLFNPNQFAITKVGWKQTENQGLVPAKEPATLSVNLFFDTSFPTSTLGRVNQAIVPLMGRPIVPPRLKLPGDAGTDVRAYTRQIAALTEHRGHFTPPRPPLCRLMWGRSREILFEGVLRQVTQTFTRFLDDGTPVRATLECEFEEWTPPEAQERQINPIDDPIRIVKRGETLSSIAAEEYGDPALWRVIAEANRMDNPRQLSPGQALTVPPLRPASVTRGRG
ncbi:CIS tube protein [Trichothermofontia sp.]